MYAIEAKNINKNFGSVNALHEINLQIEENEFFGLIGPDGAGKTTLIKILTTLLLPDSGEVIIDSKDVVKDYKELRKILGYMPGEFSLYQDLSVYENLKFFATVFGTTIKENFSLIEDIYVHLEPFKNRRAGNLSGGMKQKLALCCALIHKPSFLILDEPTTGVDAVSRQEFWQMLNRLKQVGITIVVSTPYMNEAMQCDRIALMQRGKILQTNTPNNIIESFPGKLYAVRSDKLFPCYEALQNYSDLDSVHLFGQELHVSISNELVKHEDVKNYLKTNDLDAEITKIEPGIEDCFMSQMLRTDA